MKPADESDAGITPRAALAGHEGAITAIRWAQDGRLLVSAGLDNSLRIWTLEDGQLVGQHSFRDRSFRTVAFYSGSKLSREALAQAYTYALDLAVNGYEIIAAACSDGVLRIHRVSRRPTPVHEVPITTTAVTSVDWHPTDGRLAFGADDGTLGVWTEEQGVTSQLKGVVGGVARVRWSPKGDSIAVACRDGVIAIFDRETQDILHLLLGHTGPVTSLCWLEKGLTLISASADRTIRVWDMTSATTRMILEGHSDEVTDVSASVDGQLLASRSLDNTVRLWSTRAWICAKTIRAGGTKDGVHSGLEFHPRSPRLAMSSEGDRVIRIWNLSISEILDAAVSRQRTKFYANAKVVLLGDTGVGKSGLALVLCKEPFVATDSTHGRRIWTFEEHIFEHSPNQKELREVLLWDLAGQPGYRLIHQLSLTDVAVAIIVFDARSETDPFSGVRYWAKALSQAQAASGGTIRVKKILVAARIDRGSIGVSKERVSALVESLRFDDYIETSAKEGWNITRLADCIRQSIRWTALPRTCSSDLFTGIKQYLLDQKKAGRALSTFDDIFRDFLAHTGRRGEDAMRREFETCIRLLEARSLLRRLSFGDLVLLQPELLDSYAAAIVNTAREEPDGLGTIAEEDVVRGRFRLPDAERLRDSGSERLLLIATVEDLIRHEIAIRETASSGSQLVFPSQFTREAPLSAGLPSAELHFRFRGAPQNIYSTLVVRLSHSDAFSRPEMWKNIAVFGPKVGQGRCGLSLREFEEGDAELSLFFDGAVNRDVRQFFAHCVRNHLEHRCLSGSLQEVQAVSCPSCGLEMDSRHIELRRYRGFRAMNCPVCDSSVSIETGPSQIPDETVQRVSTAAKSADRARDRQAATSVIEGKRATKDFDVFMCHNSVDKRVIKLIASELLDRGVLPWLDEWELRPGIPWQSALEDQIKSVKAAAVFVGQNGIGPWQNAEQSAFLRQFTRRGLPVIPVILPDCSEPPTLPVFLEGNTWVDFRERTPVPIDQLIWGITGERQ